MWAVTKPDGTIQGGSSGIPFTSRCGPNGNVITSSANGICPDEDIRSNCPSSVIPVDASISCYASHNQFDANNIQTTYPIVGEMCLAFPSTSGSYSRSKTQYYAEVTNATSGTYRVKTSGTDDKLDPCGSTRGQKFPCNSKPDPSMD